MPEDAKFFVSDGVYDHSKAGIGKCGADLREQWTHRLIADRAEFPTEIDQMRRIAPMREGARGDRTAVNPSDGNATSE
jgi:hypothetical protein